MPTRLLAAPLLPLLLTACATAPTEPAPQAPPAVAAEAPKKPEASAEDAAAKKAEQQKELDKKRRELRYARAELEPAAMERRLHTMATETSLRETAAALEDARVDLTVFRTSVKPRELEDKRIGLDGRVHRADHAKDELAELTAMYEADEFAKVTKELVLKRGRRELEIAERSLAVARQEFEHFEKHELPKREHELERKVEAAEHARKKAELEAQKRQVEDEIAAAKAKDRIEELERDIAELEQKLAKGGS